MPLLQGILHERQHQIVHPRMAAMEVIIAGAGMLGSWSAHALSRAVRQVHIFDGDDMVEDVNVGVQAYIEENIGLRKGQCLEQSLFGLSLKSYAELFPHQSAPTNVGAVISCVDTLDGRAAIAKWSMKHNIPLFIDTRAQGENAVLCSATPEQIPEYLGALPREEDVPDVPCGTEGTAFMGMWVASQVTCWINNWCRGMKLPKMLVWHVGTNMEINRLQYGEEDSDHDIT